MEKTIIKNLVWIRRFKSFSLTLLLTTIYILIVPSASAGTIIKSPAYLGLTRGLVGCWNFDGDYTKVPDCSGNNNTGTLTGGPTKKVGKIGQGLEFGFQTGKYVNVDDGAGNRLADINPKTICSWIYPRSFGTSTNDATIVSKHSGGGTGWGLQLADDDGGIQALYMYHLFTGNDGQWHTPASSITLNSWQYICMSYDKSSAANNPVFYINGVSQTVTRNAIPTLSAESDAASILYVGNLQADSSNSSFDGLLDDVRFYNRVLSANEINRLYKIGLGSTANRPTSSLLQGLVGCWNFDGDYAKVPDCSGNNNTGTLNGGPTQKMGKVGQALEFGFSIAKFVNIGTPTILNNITTKTVCSWIYPHSYGTSGSDATFVSKALNTNGGWIFQLADDDAGTKTLYFTQFFSSSGGIWRAPAGAITLDSWQHVCVAYDRSSSANNPVIYINGISRTVTTVSPPSVSANSDATSSLYIGSAQLDSTSSFDGIVDEVRIYNRALSANEIARLYSSTQSRFNASKSDVLANGLVGCWNFDGDFTKVPDCSGNNNTGTLTGTTRVAGKIGQALSFNGVSDGVLTSTLSLSGTNIISVSSWIYSNDFSSTDRDEFIEYSAIYTGQSGAFDFHYFDTDCTPNGNLYIAVNGNVGGNSNCYTPPSTGTWHHYVAIYNFGSAGQETSLYIDGVLQTPTSSITINNNTGNFSNQQVYLGSRGLSTNWFDGKMDNVRIYNRALSAGEINKLYQMGR